MTPKDPTTYADLSQGRIQHIDFRIKVNFDERVFDVEATYQLKEPISGELTLDSYKIDLKDAKAKGRALMWEFGDEDEALGQRLLLKGFENDSSFTLSFRTSPEARALQWMNASQTKGGEHPFLFSQCQATHARSVFPCQDVGAVHVFGGGGSSISVEGGHGGGAG